MSKAKPEPTAGDPLGGNAWEDVENNLGEAPAPEGEAALRARIATLESQMASASAAVVKEPKPRQKAAAPAPVVPRTRIILEESDEIPPSGQFFGADGIGYMLRPGEEADVPDSIISILDTAVKSVPIKDGSDTVIGYRDRLRFPYRIITQRRAA